MTHCVLNWLINEIALKSMWKELVKETDDVLYQALCFDHDKLALCYTQHVKAVLYIHDLTSGERLFEIPMPAPGNIQGDAAPLVHNSLSGQTKVVQILYRDIGQKEVSLSLLLFCFFPLSWYYFSL